MFHFNFKQLWLIRRSLIQINRNKFFPKYLAICWRLTALANFMSAN